MGLKLITEQEDSREETMKKIILILKEFNWDVEIGKYGINGSNKAFSVLSDNSKEGGNCIIIEVMKEFYFEPIKFCYEDDTQFRKELIEASKNMELAIEKNK